MFQQQQQKKMCFSHGIPQIFFLHLNDVQIKEFEKKYITETGGFMQYSIVKKALTLTRACFPEWKMESVYFTFPNAVYVHIYAEKLFYPDSAQFCQGLGTIRGMGIM